MYAIVQISGQQHKVTPGQTIDVDLMSVAEGNEVELDKVLLIANEGNLTIGTPTIDGAKVVATALGTIRGDKVVVLRYKPKVRYCKKTGNRQSYTRLAINQIVAGNSGKSKRSST